ncbi:hypothetical protein BDA96_01G095400 [Sorghum bicolor]|uniref:Uncharacterized protein n=1 Tax=Sorghum bicolor TaxID=4558 RepID=A0A921RYP8_SORBI|nr:hypothetical protein BDA96_01G095400 [Sorghum bicolor]
MPMPDRWSALLHLAGSQLQVTVSRYRAHENLGCPYLFIRDEREARMTGIFVGLYGDLNRLPISTAGSEWRSDLLHLWACLVTCRIRVMQ